MRAVLGLGLGVWGRNGALESVEGYMLRGIAVGSSYMFKQGGERSAVAGMRAP